MNSFAELIAWRATETPTALFAIDEQGRSLTFAEFSKSVARTASAFRDRGVKEGSVVSWTLPTRIDSMILAAALSHLGAVQNLILPAYRERELGFILRQVNPQLVIVPGVYRGYDYAQAVKPLAKEVLVLDGALPESDGAVPAKSGRWIFYTSGTTSDPKGVKHIDRSLMAGARGMALALGLAQGDRHAIVFPFTHVGGPLWLAAGLFAGATQLVVERWDPAATISFLGREGVTHAGAGTVFHQAYLQAQRQHADRPIFPWVRAFPGGGAPKPPGLFHDLKRELGGAGIISGYGLTECPVISMNRIGDSDEKLAHSEGRPNPIDAQIRIVDGEVRVRGPQLFAGYMDRSIDRAAFDEDGFFRTGDLGALDSEGHLTITGRLKDVIIRKGENISAKEIEDLLYQHPSVADVAVVGLPDDKMGERVCAVVVAKSSLELSAIVAFLRERGLMTQKLPEQLETVEVLPRNATGKIDKRALRTRFGS